MIIKKRNFWIILLLISFSFSIAHAFVIEANEIEHCSAQDYAQEFSQSNDRGDLCDLSHMFYISFILPVHSKITEVDNRVAPVVHVQRNWISDYTFSTFRPPIVT